MYHLVEEEVDEMQPVADAAREQWEALLAEELADARDTNRAVSRVQLARLLRDECRVPLKRAEEFVENYCDERSPSTPEFLGSEFGIGYLKVIAVLNVAVAITVLVLTLRFQRATQPQWPGILFGCFFVVLAAVSWVNSLRPVKQADEQRRARRASSGMAVVEVDARRR